MTDHEPVLATYRWETVLTARGATLHLMLPNDCVTRCGIEPWPDDVVRGRNDAEDHSILKCKRCERCADD